MVWLVPNLHDTNPNSKSRWFESTKTKWRKNESLLYWITLVWAKNAAFFPVSSTLAYSRFSIWQTPRSSTPPQCRIGWHKATSVPVAKTKKDLFTLKMLCQAAKNRMIWIKVTKRRCLVSTKNAQIRLGGNHKKALLNFFPAAINGFVQLISHCHYMRWGIMTKWCQSCFLLSFLSIIQSYRTKKKILDPYKLATLMPFSSAQWYHLLVSS